jgi:predicted enzyme related to lactoylglutathione lyase
MDVLSSRILLRPSNPSRSKSFYRNVLGLAVYREFGDPAEPGLVFFLGNGYLEVFGQVSPDQDAHTDPRLSLWLQVRDVDAERERLTRAGVPIDREPTLEPWGLREMWISDPDGVPIVLVQIPDDHPLRRDPR